MNTRDLNRRLSVAYLISTFGDWLAYFGFIVLAHQVSNDIAKSAYVIAFKSLGVGLGAVLIPPALSKLGLRASILLSLILCGLIFLAIYFLSSDLSFPLILIYALCVFESLLQQLFEGARETYSKTLGDATAQRSLQADILGAFYGGQLGGPILAVVLLQFFHFKYLFLLNAVSFFVAAYLVWSAPNTHPKINSKSVLNSFSYLKKSKPLNLLFIVRTYLIWIPLATTNLVLYELMTKRFHLPIEMTALAYSIIGLGSLIAAGWLRRYKSQFMKRLHTSSDATICSWVLSLLAVTRVPLVLSPSFLIAIPFLFVGGIFNGANMICSQSLRRKLCTDDQFPEVVGLEKFISKFIEWGVTSIVVFLLSHELANYFQLYLFAATCMVLISVLYRAEALRKV